MIWFQEGKIWLSLWKIEAALRVKTPYSVDCGARRLLGKPSALLAPCLRKKGFPRHHDTFSNTPYTCAECEEGYRKLDRLPMWHKRIVGWPARVRWEREIEQAAEKARRTGNPEDARVRDGDGYLRRIP